MRKKTKIAQLKQQRDSTSPNFSRKRVSEVDAKGHKLAICPPKAAEDSATSRHDANNVPRYTVEVAMSLLTGAQASRAW